MHLLVFIKKLAPALGLVFVITNSWLWHITGSEIINQTKNRSSHTSLAPVNKKTIPSSTSLANSDHVVLSDNSSLQQLTQGLHPGRGEPIPAAQDVHELPVMDVSFYNKRGYLLSGWLAIHSPLAPVIILTHGTPGNRVEMI